MRMFWLVMLLLPGSLLAPSHTNIAQEAPATIVRFDATTEGSPITINALERGEITLTLSWLVINGVEDEQRLLLEAYRINQWVPIPPEDDPTLPWPFEGERTLDLQHPLNFGQPTYRLSIRDAENETIDQRIVTIPYDVDSIGTPRITRFTVDATTISAPDLSQGSAQVGVSWEVENRLPTSNLVFEQVQADGSFVSIELPRPNVWVTSTGEGVVAPLLPQLGSEVRVRLRVIDAVSNEVYAEATQTLTAVTLPVLTQSPDEDNEGDTTDTITAMVDLPTNEDCSASPTRITLIGTQNDACNTDDAAGITIETFTTDTDMAAPGETITLVWRVSGIDGAVLEIYSLNDVLNAGVDARLTPLNVFNGLSTIGSVTYTLPEGATAGIRVVLFATDLAQVFDADSLPATLPYAILDIPSSDTEAATEGDSSDGDTGQTEGEAPEVVSSVEMDGAYQAFEEGFMVWFGETESIWVFTKNGQVRFYPAGRYVEAPENPVEDEAPPERVKPIRGFGQLWGNVDDVREALGWGLGNEEGYTLTLDTSAPLRGVTQFTLNLPDGSTIRAYSDGRWEDAS